MCHDKLSGMKLVFLKYIKELNEKDIEATPAKIAREYNMTYRHILNIAYYLVEKKLIKRITADWRVRYELTKDGNRILYKKDN